jgi:hypothetical protein
MWNWLWAVNEVRRLTTCSLLVWKLVIASYSHQLRKPLPAGGSWNHVKHPSDGEGSDVKQIWIMWRKSTAVQCRCLCWDDTNLLHLLITSSKGTLQKYINQCAVGPITHKRWDKILAKYNLSFTHYRFDLSAWNIYTTGVNPAPRVLSKKNPTHHHIHFYLYLSYIFPTSSFLHLSPGFPLPWRLPINAAQPTHSTHSQNSDWPSESPSILGLLHLH